MNGFEPLRRRIIDYTEAGQWSEVYDGPLEDSESEKLQAENAKLRERVAELEELTDGKLYIPQEWYQLAMTENAKLQEFAAEAWELLTCNEPIFVWVGLQKKARELGVEVDDG